MTAEFGRSEYPPRMDSVVRGRYIVEDLLGSGGYGAVVRAFDQFLEERVALKFFDTDDEDPRRFAHEVAAMQAVRHPNVVEILHVDMEHVPPYFVMPLANGTLDSWAATNRANTRAILDRFLEVCAGVSALHAANHVHRDIKPANMLVYGDHAVISDLGLARNLEADASKLTRSTAVIGTAAYMAPEQKVRGGARAADRRTDVYALGRSLYELLTGEAPFLIDDLKLDMSAAIIINQATAEQPSKRHPTVEDLAEEIRAYQRLLDPSINAVDQLTSLLETAAARIKGGAGNFAAAELRELMRIWTSIRAEEVALEKWDQIPAQLLPLMVKVDAEAMERVLLRLWDVLQSQMGGQGWAYAEDVAERMQAICEHTTASRVKAGALQNALYAAVLMNRFRAMDIFNDTLKAITDATDAAAVAAMLRARRNDYGRIAQQVEPEQLHVFIREERAAAISAEKEQRR